MFLSSSLPRIFAVYTWCCIGGLSLRWDCLPSATPLGHSTLFGTDSVGAKIPAGYQLTPAEFAAHPFCKHTKWVIGHTNAYLHCNLAFVYTVMDFFSCANVGDASAKWMSSKGVPLKTYISFQNPARNSRSARKIGAWMDVFYFSSPSIQEKS